MKNYLYYLSIFLPLLSCTPNNSNQEATDLLIARGDSLLADTTYLRPKAKSKLTPEFVSSEQLVAIKGIKFGIREKEFNKRVSTFLNPLSQSERYRIKGSTYGEYKLGEYKFSSVDSDYFKGQLYKIRLKGEPISYEYYKSEMVNQYDALKTLLVEKYGEPIVDIGLPEWTDIDKGYENTCSTWQIGDKLIQMIVGSSGTFYNLDLKISQTKINQEITRQEQAKRDNSIKSASNSL